MINFWFHIPLWKATWGNDGPSKRIYFRYEFLYSKDWASGGMNKDKSFRIYQRGFGLDNKFTLCQGKISYALTWSEF